MGFFQGFDVWYLMPFIVLKKFCKFFGHHQMSSHGGTPLSSTGGKATGRTTISGAVNFPGEARIGWT